jgi:hypothetical protein
MRFARWVDASSVEVLFDDGSGINVLENSDLSFVLVSLYFKHFPSEHDIDAAFVALLKGNFVCIWESINFLIGGPVLDAGVVGGAAVKLVLSHKVLVVESVEISAFALVGELGRVADQVAVGVVPAMQEVA